MLKCTKIEQHCICLLEFRETVIPENEVNMPSVGISSFNLAMNCMKIGKNCSSGMPSNKLEIDTSSEVPNVDENSNDANLRTAERELRSPILKTDE